MNSPTFQILTLLTVILLTIMTVVLFAVRQANRQIPGLRAWACSYLLGLLLASTSWPGPTSLWDCRSSSRRS